jgi:hypothetical protein
MRCSGPAGLVYIDTLYYSQYGRFRGHIQRARQTGVTRYIVRARYTVFHGTMLLCYVFTFAFAWAFT